MRNINRCEYEPSTYQAKYTRWNHRKEQNKLKILLEVDESQLHQLKKLQRTTIEHKLTDEGEKPVCR